MKRISEFDNFLNEASNLPTSPLMNLKIEIFGEAKKKYMEAIAAMLKSEGINVLKINYQNGEVDDFSQNTFECVVGKEKFTIKMSNRGVSIGTEKITGYSTNISSFVSKLQRI